MRKKRNNINSTKHDKHRLCHYNRNQAYVIISSMSQLRGGESQWASVHLLTASLTPSSVVAPPSDGTSTTELSSSFGSSLSSSSPPTLLAAVKSEQSSCDKTVELLLLLLLGLLVVLTTWKMSVILWFVAELLLVLVVEAGNRCVFRARLCLFFAPGGRPRRFPPSRLALCFMLLITFLCFVENDPFTWKKLRETDGCCCCWCCAADNFCWWFARGFC